MPADCDPRVHPMAGDKTEGRDTIHTVTAVYTTRDRATRGRFALVCFTWHDKHGYGGGEREVPLSEWRRSQKNRKVLYAAD